MNEELYSTGEFAKLCGVRKQTLFHYDHIDLLKPTYVDEHGFRWYAPAQYEDFLMISCLKEADMSLSEIKDYLASDDANAKAGALWERIQLLDDKIAHLQQVRRTLALRFDAQENRAKPGAEENKETRLLVREARTMWATPPLDELDDAKLVQTVSRIVRAAEPTVVCLPSAMVINGNLDTQRYLLIDAENAPANPAALDLAPFEQPAGKYAEIDLYPDEDPAAVYKRLIDDLELIECHPGEYFYEETPVGTDATQDSPTVIAVEIFLNDE